MKKAILFLLFCMAGCVCNNEELGRYMIDNSNKEYLKTNSETVSFKDQEGNTIVAEFEAANYYTQKDDVGPESCEYYTYEYGKRKFNLGKYHGEINMSDSSLSIQINNYVAYNVLSFYNSNESIFDNLTQNIELAGFTFSDVLILERNKQNSSSIWDIEKIVYTKTNGIEFILFKNGNWYKR